MDEYVFNILVKAVENSAVFQQLQENAKKTAESMQKSFNESFKTMNINAKQVAKEIGMGFRENLKKINLIADDTAKAVGKDMQKIADSAKSAGDKTVKGFTFSFGQIGDIFKALVLFRITRFALDMFTDIIQNSIKFERDLKTILAVSGGGDEGVLRKAVMEDMKEIPFSIFKLTESLELLTKAGYSAKESIFITSSAADLAVGANEDLNKTVMLVTDTLSAYDLAVEQAGHVTDIFARATVVSKLGIENLNTAMRQVAPLAGVVGVSLEDTLAILASLADFGVRGGKGGSTLRQFLQGILDVTPEAVVRLNELGVSAKFLQDHLDEPIVLMQMLAQTTFSAQDAVLIFGKHFGGYISKLVDQFKDGTKNARDFKQEILNNADASKKMADTVESSTSVAVDKLAASWERLTVAMSDGVIGIVMVDAITLTSRLVSLLEKISKLGMSNEEFISRLPKGYREDVFVTKQTVDMFNAENVLKAQMERTRLQDELTKKWGDQVAKIKAIRDMLEQNELDAENKRALAEELAKQNLKNKRDRMEEESELYKQHKQELERLRLTPEEIIAGERELARKLAEPAAPSVLPTSTQLVSSTEAFRDNLKMVSAQEGARNVTELQKSVIELAETFDVSAVAMFDSISAMALQTDQTFGEVVENMKIALASLNAVLLGLGAGIAMFFQTLVTDSENAGKAFAAAFTGTIGQALIASGTAMLLTLNPVTMAQGAAMIAAGGTLIGLSQLMRSDMKEASEQATDTGKEVAVRSSRSFEITGVERDDNAGRHIVINVNTERPLATQREITESVLTALRYGKAHGLQA